MINTWELRYLFSRWYRYKTKTCERVRPSVGPRDVILWGKWPSQDTNLWTPSSLGATPANTFFPERHAFCKNPIPALISPRCLLLFITSCSVHMFYSGAHQMIRLQGVLGFAVLNAPRPWFEPCFRCCQKGCGLFRFYNISNLSSAMKMVYMINIDK